MAQPYNLTNISSSETLFELTKNANELTGGLMGNLIIVTVFIIAFIGFKSTWEGQRSFAGASFITALISIFVRILGMITDQVMFGTFLIAGISYVLLRWSK